jgi:putative transcriptional regulator
MIMRAPRRIAAILAVSCIIGFIGFVVPASAEKADSSLGSASLKGKFLVASPTIADPRFEHTVILIIKHDATGAFGLIINRPVGVAEVTPDESGPRSGGDSGPPPDIKPMHFYAFLGGPVEPEKAFIIHSPDYKVDGTVEVTPHVYVTANVQILKDIADGNGPKHTLYVVGYAGWNAGQLEEEMRRNSWYEAPVDDKLIFDGDDAEDVWEQAMETRLRGI